MALVDCTIPTFDEVADPSAMPTLRVLLIEDDPVSLKILKKRISSGGYIVETAIDGRDGLQKYEEFQPHIIISDWMMPNMDGRELCAAIKGSKAGKSIYFILLTARDKHEDIVQALDTGADEYLIKPCHGPELMARLRAAERLLHLQSALAQSNKDLKHASARIEKELQDISNIQRSLLPQRLPQVPGYLFAAHYQPSTECSGDFYDVLRLDENRLGIVIGDISGHGAPAMVAMALLRMLYRMESKITSDPAEFMSHINAKMFDHLPTDQYATMFYGVLEMDSGRLRYCSAGHPPAVRVNQASQKADYIEGCEGFPVKLVDPTVDYSNQELILPKGHSMLFFTDGLPEAFNEAGDVYGYERLTDTMGRLAGFEPVQTIDGLLEDLDDFRRDVPFADDLSILLMIRE